MGRSPESTDSLTVLLKKQQTTNCILDTDKSIHVVLLSKQVTCLKKIVGLIKSDEARADVVLPEASCSSGCVIVQMRKSMSISLTV